MGNFKQRFGTWCSLNSVNAVDVICSTDLDFVIIDEEHSSVSFEGMENMVRACEARGKQAIIRSSNDDKQHLLRISEAGSNGFTAMVAEERSRDQEVRHAREKLSFLALSSTSGSFVTP